LLKHREDFTYFFTSPRNLCSYPMHTMLRRSFTDVACGPLSREVSDCRTVQSFRSRLH
jgi:hypothetical protein